MRSSVHSIGFQTFLSCVKLAAPAVLFLALFDSSAILLFFFSFFPFGVVYQQQREGKVVVFPCSTHCCESEHGISIEHLGNGNPNSTDTVFPLQ